MLSIKYSIIIESDNLKTGSLQNIFKSLDSLEQQYISIHSANEIILFDTLNDEKLKQLLLQKYTWLQIINVQESSYYPAKMDALSYITGDIVVYADSDCVYSKYWLYNILKPFYNDGVDIVSGQTRISTTNQYENAISYLYFFPRVFKKTQPYLTTSYFLNNVAFRKEILIKYPIPLKLPLYRGNCAIHAYYLTSLLKKHILFQPFAQAIHAAPDKSFIFKRTWLRASDALFINLILKYLSQNQTINLDQHIWQFSFKDMFLTALKLFKNLVTFKYPYLFKNIRSINYIFWFLSLEFTYFISIVFHVFIPRTKTH